MFIHNDLSQNIVPVSYTHLPPCQPPDVWSGGNHGTSGTGDAGRDFVLKMCIRDSFLVFVVMAAQFESVKFSIMVMTTIPFSLVGSFGLLKLTGVSISMTSLLGFLILVGTVVNNRCV